jgi:hypothetical protein
VSSRPAKPFAAHNDCLADAPNVTPHERRSQDPEGDQWIMHVSPTDDELSNLHRRPHRRRRPLTRSVGEGDRRRIAGQLACEPALTTSHKHIVDRSRGRMMG